MQWWTLFKISQSERHQFCQTIIESSSPRADFYFLVLLSALIVSLGIVHNNLILVIGGMLVTPLLSPILAIALGLVVWDWKTVYWSGRTFLAALGLTFLVTATVGWAFARGPLSQLQLVKMMEASWFSFLVALIAGVAASYTWAKPELNNNLPGVAITVTLMPPLAIMGLAAPLQDWVVLDKAIRVLFLNIGGIILASIIVFLFMEFYRCKRKVVAEVKEEEQEINGEHWWDKLKFK
ncbi:DUF389 domain-containing protein [Candidatus Parcubacteria bacterium]|nr:MAG: DUF389 domain-containing protein [Candidatus Parcubacteria bacterium]